MSRELQRLSSPPRSRNVDSPLERLLAGKRPKDRPLVVGARIDPSQYTAQF
jgi:hypothetical protein